MPCKLRPMRFFENKWPAILIWPLSLLYGLIMLLRNLCYDWGILKIHRLSCPVISVGNITVGGTGKTPTVAFLAKHLQSKGKRVCIISRGYGRSSHGTVVVSDKEKMLASVDEAGDEPFLLARRLKGVPVVVDEDRVRGGKLATSLFHPDVILLDDGFQHRRLHRDLDIVTFKSTNLLGNGFVLPAGPLREFIFHLKRARLFWINSVTGRAKIDHALSSFSQTCVRARYVAQRLSDISGAAISLRISGLRVIGFCALANPASFRKSIEQTGATLVGFFSFPDHYFYTLRDVEKLESAFKKCNAHRIITTEKDWVKLPPHYAYGSFWQYLTVEILPDDIALVDDHLEKVLSENAH
jgi:tetraacyldisaccharide 4'-kinase